MILLLSALYCFFQIFYREHYCYNHKKKITAIKFLTVIITISYQGTKLKVCFLKGQNKTKKPSTSWFQASQYYRRHSMLHPEPDPKLTLRQVCRAGPLGAGTPRGEPGALSSGRAHTQERRAMKTAPQRRGAHGGAESTWLSEPREGAVVQPR